MQSGKREFLGLDVLNLILSVPLSWGQHCEESVVVGVLKERGSSTVDQVVIEGLQRGQWRPGDLLSSLYHSMQMCAVHALYQTHRSLRPLTVWKWRKLVIAYGTVVLVTLINIKEFTLWKVVILNKVCCKCVTEHEHCVHWSLWL